jgi:hypothetical protein
VIEECVSAPVILDELSLAERVICESSRTTFEEMFRGRHVEFSRLIDSSLQSESQAWQSSLGQQSAHSEAWMAEQISTEIGPISEAAGPVAEQISTEIGPISEAAGPVAERLVDQAELRFRRVVEAFRDRITRNIGKSTGISISPAAWEGTKPRVAVVPVRISRPND